MCQGKGRSCGSHAQHHRPLHGCAGRRSEAHDQAGDHRQCAAHLGLLLQHDGNHCHRNAGDRRARGQYPLGSFKAAGARMAAGTDFPVILPPSPFAGFKVGVTRTVPHDHPEYEQYKDVPMGPKENPLSEAVSLEDMIEMYTRRAAYQMFFDDVAGCLEAGKSADFVILNETITQTEAEFLDRIQAESVYFKGHKIV
ncbi:hypothetical protein D3Z38_06920 [Clostridiales bacterium]|nr:hypothetical protein [Clostridiales bacterium]